jgi:hypothetical protein
MLFEGFQPGALCTVPVRATVATVLWLEATLAQVADLPTVDGRLVVGSGGLLLPRLLPRGDYDHGDLVGGTPQLLQAAQPLQENIVLSCVVVYCSTL